MIKQGPSYIKTSNAKLCNDTSTFKNDCLCLQKMNMNCHFS